MEKSRTIGEREIRSPELVRMPALQHAYRKGGDPSHKSKMEDLTVEVCGENGAYYKVRSVKSIQKKGRRIWEEDSQSRGPRHNRIIARLGPVLRECTALKCSRGNAASSDAMSRLTGRDFPADHVAARTRARSRRSPEACPACRGNNTRTRRCVALALSLPSPPEGVAILHATGLHNPLHF